MPDDGRGCADELIGVLQDRGAPAADRAGAAVDLGEFDETEALTALLQIASDPDEDEAVLGSCGESIAEIWARRRKLDGDAMARLAKPAKFVLVATLSALAPHLLRAAAARKSSFDDEAAEER